jgi:hypothetical protein
VRVSISPSAHDRIIAVLKRYHRVSLGSTVGELIKKYEFSAYGMSEAKRIAVRDYVKKIDFDTVFANFWLTGLPFA